MDTQHKVLGVFQIIKFFVSFGVRYKVRSKLTSILFKVGAAMI